MVASHHLPEGSPPSGPVDDRTDERTCDETKHGVVAAVISHSRVMNVMRQTGNELVTIGDGRDLDRGREREMMRSRRKAMCRSSVGMREKAAGCPRVRR